MKYTLRSASDADMTWLEQLRRSAYQDLFKATWGGWDEARHARQFAESMQRGHVSIIEVDATPVGMIQAFETRDAIEVGEIQIMPRFQNRGISQRVLRNTIEEAHRSKRRVDLSLGLKNERAFRLYQRLGFHEVGRSETHLDMSCPIGSQSPND